KNIAYNEGFLEDELDRLQATLFYLMDKVQLDDIIEIWKLIGLTRIYKHYMILLVDRESVGVMIQFQHVDNIELIINNFHVFNQLKIPYTFTTKVQHVQKKVKYLYEFGKIKKALNIALDLG
ncbi:14095_t:CDS:2, partial [Gigaspora margarita]